MEIIATGEFELRDVVRAVRAVIFRRKWLWYGVACFGAIVLCLSVLVIIVRPSATKDVWPAPVVMAAWATLIWWLPNLSARKQWSGNATMRGRQEFRFDIDGMTHRGPTSGGDVKWAGFSSWQEDQEQFRLLFGSCLVCFVPKRFLSSPEQVESLRELLRANLPKR